VNVNVARLEKNTITSRTYERGVEDETLACGSGAISIAFAAAHIHKLPTPIQITPASGDILRVDLNTETIFLTGPATFVYRGVEAISLSSVNPKLKCHSLHQS
jgi:diaminopimelate epimerase